MGPYTRLGVTTGTNYVDRDATAGVHYQYSVVAVAGSDSSAASLAGQSPLTSVADVRDTLTNLTTDGELSRTSAGRINRLLSEVATAPPSGGSKAAALRSLGLAVSRSGATDAAADDLGAAVYNLGRSVVSAQRGCVR